MNRSTYPYTALTACLFLAGAGTEGGTTLDIVGLLREFGFPIFVALWFMWRLEKRLDRSAETTEKLITIVTVMAKTIDDLPAGPPGPPGPIGPPGPPRLPPPAPGQGIAQPGTNPKRR